MPKQSTSQLDTDKSNMPYAFSLKTLVVIVLFLFGIYFLVPRLVGIPEVLKLILHVNKSYLIIGFIFEIISYVGAAILLGLILSTMGYKIKFFDRFKIGSIAAFAIHFFPVGSLGQGAVDYAFLRKRDVEAGSILLMWVLRIIISYTAFLIIFLVGLILLPTIPHLKLSPKLISLIIFAVLSFLAGYIIYLYRHKDQFRVFWNRFLRFFDSFLSKVRGRKVSQERESEIFEDIYRGIGLFGRKKRYSVYAVLAAAIFWLGDITCFYFVFLSFGYHIHWGILIFGYCISALLGMISFIPGGLGVTEGSMGLLFASLGVPSSLAIMSILVFRFFSFWIWIPFGFYSFVSLSRNKK